MKPKNFLENETILKEFQNGSDYLLITSKRVRYKRSLWGSKHGVSIMLNEVCSISVHFKQYIQLVILAVLFILLTLYLSSEPVSAQPIGPAGPSSGYYSFLLISLLLIILFFMTRRKVLVISSAADRIILGVKKLKPEQVSEFVDTIEQAKDSQDKV